MLVTQFPVLYRNRRATRSPGVPLLSTPSQTRAQSRSRLRYGFYFFFLSEKQSERRFHWDCGLAGRSRSLEALSRRLSRRYNVFYSTIAWTTAALEDPIKIFLLGRLVIGERAKRKIRIEGERSVQQHSHRSPLLSRSSRFRYTFSASIRAVATDPLPSIRDTLRQITACLELCRPVPVNAT